MNAVSDKGNLAQSIFLFISFQVNFSVPSNSKVFFSLVTESCTHLSA